VTVRELNSFRGARALVVHPHDANRETLVRTLKQLGLLVAEVGSDDEAAILAARGDCDVLFYDADQTPASLFGANGPDVDFLAAVRKGKLAWSVAHPTKATEQEMAMIARAVIEGKRPWSSVHFYDEQGRRLPQWPEPDWRSMMRPIGKDVEDTDDKWIPPLWFSTD